MARTSFGMDSAVTFLFGRAEMAIVSLVLISVPLRWEEWPV